MDIDMMGTKVGVSVKVDDGMDGEYTTTTTETTTTETHEIAPTVTETRTPAINVDPVRNPGESVVLENAGDHIVIPRTRYNSNKKL